MNVKIVDGKLVGYPTKRQRDTLSRAVAVLEEYAAVDRRLFDLGCNMAIAAKMTTIRAGESDASADTEGRGVDRDRGGNLDPSEGDQGAAGIDRDTSAAGDSSQ